jgi:uncharacterized protein YecT (DUF1311 family)
LTSTQPLPIVRIKEIYMPKTRLLVGLMALTALGGCKSWLFDKRPDEGNAVNISEASPMDNLVANIDQGNAATASDQQCASQATYDAIKKQLFDNARKKVTTNPKPLFSLQNASAVRMTAPVVTNANPQLQRTQCSGQLTLMLPPTASNAFGGTNMLSATMTYIVQQAADHSGTVVQIAGADTVSDQLASATDMLGQRRNSGDVSGSADFGQGKAAGSVTAFAGKTYNPSFDCGGRLTNAMRMICQDEDLAGLDRDLSALYGRKKGATPKPDLPALVQAQRDFLKSRDNCADTECMKNLYSMRSDQLDTGE